MMRIVLERSRLLAWRLVVTLTAPLAATAQPGGATATFTGEQLEQLAAPIALYPDPLLAQVMMASAYPLEIVQTARFVKDNPNLKGDQLDEKLKDQTWDDNTIQVCLAYVDAQREYYARDPDGDALLQYAQKFGSSPGKRDGLYWPTNPGEPPSPLGPFVARARGEGYRNRSANPVAYWGYPYRILTAHGKDAPGGAYDYLAHGKMIGGFALVAYPARYGVSGVMTFIVNQDGVVYQKNLGPNSAATARAMKQFNPDGTWQKV